VLVTQQTDMFKFLFKERPQNYIIFFGKIIFLVYFIGMILVPILTSFSGGNYIFRSILNDIQKKTCLFDWNYIHSVWHDWQTLNAGMLALFASIIALTAARINEEKKRQRNFIAAQALLPASLAELSDYFDGCVPLLKEWWSNLDDKKQLNLPCPQNTLPSKIPSDCWETLKNCISHISHDETRKDLALIVKNFQIFNCRMKGTVLSTKGERTSAIFEIHIKERFYELAYLATLVQKAFPFSRGEEDCPSTQVTLTEITNTYFILGIKTYNPKYKKISVYTKNQVKHEQCQSPF